jgi:hypothetical protein
LQKLAAEVTAAGRNLAELDIVYRTHTYDLRPDAVSTSERQPFVGHAAELAADIRQYAALGVTHLVVDFMRGSGGLDEILRRMEAFATQVWPRV